MDCLFAAWQQECLVGDLGVVSITEQLILGSLCLVAGACNAPREEKYHIFYFSLSDLALLQ